MITWFFWIILSLRGAIAVFDFGISDAVVTKVQSIKHAGFVAVLQMCCVGNVRCFH
jgi:hypothetical protein